VRESRKYILLVLILAWVYVVSLFIGRYMTPPWELSGDPTARNIIKNIRLPRIIMAGLLGLILSISGVAFQSAFRNPLVSPGILGVSQGCGFGAALAILYFSSSHIAVEISAVIFGLSAFGLVYLVSRGIRYGGRVLRLILAGIAVSAFFGGLIGMMKYLADPLDQLPEITFWLLGGLSGLVWEDIWFVLPLASICFLVLFVIRWRLNLLILEDEVSISLGTKPGRLRLIAVVAGVVGTAAVTAVAGIVVWVGLLVPHISRKLFGTDNGKVLPASALIGATIMIIFDDIARTISPGEIPLGVVTALIGAPLFILFLSQKWGRYGG